MAINIFKKDEKGPSGIKETTGEDTSKKAKKAKTEATAKTAISIEAVKVLRGAHITEKSARLAEENKYVFKVAPHANKIEVAKAIESSYKVTVTGVNVVNIPEKSRRRGRGIAVKPGYRKAIVSIKEGQVIEVLPK